MQTEPETICEFSKGSDGYLRIVCRKCRKACTLSLPPGRQLRSTSGYSENIIDIECTTCGILAKVSA
jgi:hypothetical protein